MKIVDNIKEDGFFYLLINNPPVSLQSKSKKKNEFKQTIANQLTGIETFFSHDIKVIITWHIHEELRYQTDTVSDLDNIIKPILDSLSGLNGIMIDDNQVQSIDCIWIDEYDREKQFVEVEINSVLDNTISKQDLQFICFGNLCYPINLFDLKNNKTFILKYIAFMEDIINQKRLFRVLCQ